MQKVGIYILFLVIGVIIGASIVTYLNVDQNLSMTEQVKVTIQGIEYTVSDHSVLEIELLNDVPEKNLEGNVTVYQDEKQWTSDVTWYYTGYGEAEIICDLINETQEFRLTYIEKNPKATYLDRIIEWKEVSGQTFTFMKTEELRITSVTFTNATALTVNLQNTGTTDVTITGVTVTGGSVTAATLTQASVTKGSTGSFVVRTTGNMAAGTPYNVELLSTKGNKFSYTETA